MPGYRPSALGAATKVRMGEPGIEISAYSVVTIIVGLAESLAKKHGPVNSFHEKADPCQEFFLLFP